MSEPSSPSGWWRLTFRLILISTSVFAIYANAFSVLAPNYNRMVHWGLLGTFVYLSYGAKGLARKTPSLPGIALAVLTLISSVFVILDWESYLERTGLVTGWELLFGCLMILLVLEATRRTIGWFLPLLVTLFVLYGIFGQYAPGIFLHKGYSLSRLIGTLYLGTSGVYGLPMEISSTYVIMFVIFGMLLTRSGGDRWFIDLAFTLTGRIRGGPALSAILSSGIMGMLSGSPVANVVTTGNVTIPLMKRTGFQPHVAGAIEAVASTAGMFTPPLMGAGAFLIAEFLHLPYVDVAKAAVLPALLFYLSLMAVVYFTAWREDLRIQAGEKLPNLWHTLLQYGHMTPPLIVLVVMIFNGRSLMLSAFWAMGLTVGLSLLRSHTRISLSKLISALEEGARKVIPIATACASAGIIVGIISLTGLGFTLSGALTGLAEGQPVLLLAVAMVASLCLGMAVPPTAVYIIIAGLTVPAMVSAGFDPLASHLFIFFCSSIGAITPPVALAAYAASAIAGSKVTLTGFTAFRLGIAGYLIPFLVVYWNGLMMVGTAGTIMTALAFSITVIMVVVLSLEFLRHLPKAVMSRMKP